MILNKYKIVAIIMVLGVVFTFCSTPKTVVEPISIKGSKPGKHSITIAAKAGTGHNHPTFVIWQEDLEGNVLQTLYVSKAYATGIFGHANVGDTAWLDKPGKSYQPSALPYWTNKKGLIGGVTYVPTPEHPFTDAITGATPKAGFYLSTNLDKVWGTRILLEVNQAWDWNDYWTNDKIPNNESYKHSAQPSLVYAVRISENDSTFYLNPIGHGDPVGKSGKLFTDLSGFTTAKEIFPEIKLLINK